MKPNLKYVVPVVIIALMLVMHACIKDNFDFDKLTNEVHWKPSLAAPIAYGSLHMIDAMEAYDSVGRLQVNDDGFLSLMYFETAESDTVSEIMDIGNQQLHVNVPATGVDWTGFTTGDHMTINRSYDLHFDLFNDDAELDSIWLDHGTLNLAAVSTYQHAIELVMTLPTVTKDGAPFSRTLNLLPYGSSDEDMDNDMDGYDVDMTQTPLGYNEIPVELEITFVHSGGLNTGDLEFQVDLLNPDHQAMFGYFGYNTLIFKSGKIDIDLFDPGDNWDIDDFKFEDPQFKVYYRNSYGIPANFYFDSVNTHSMYYDETHDLVDYGAGLPMDSLNPYNISHTTSFGTFIRDSLILDKNNSNISEIISRRPTWCKFVAHAHTNPFGDSGHHNFVWDDSKFIADIEIELPLWGYMDRFHGRDTADFDLEEEFEDPGVIEYLMLRLTIDNGLPAGAYTQAYFLDENYVVLDSVLKETGTQLIASAEVDGDGRVISKTRKVNDIVVTGEMLDKLMATKYLVYRADASTTNASNDKLIKIYPEYSVDFNAAVEADLDVEVDLDTVN
ncbi:MAG: hypothetical protein U9Q98_01140 [Bacteroidota bacterium]|nr:hypothetical protein [Bacteroidota bacterium]